MRRKRFNFFSILSGSLLVLFFGTSCINQHSPNRSSIKPQRLRWSVAEAPALSLSQIFACRSTSCWRHAFLVMEGLTRVTAVDGSVVAAPALAEKWTSPNPLEIVFHLRPGLRWSTGEPFTASNIIESWKRALAQCRKNPGAQHLFAIRGAKAYCEAQNLIRPDAKSKSPRKNYKPKPLPEISGLRAVDATTLQVTLRQPAPSLVKWVSHPSLWPWSDAGSENGAGLGPFVPEKSQSPTRAIRYKKNPNYFAADVRLDGIDLSVEKQTNVRAQLFAENQLDLVDDLTTESLPTLRSNPALRTYPSDERVALFFNPAKKPFHSRVARKAFAQTIARDEWISLMKQPYFEAATLTGLPLTGPSPYGVRYDVAGAKVWKDLQPEAAPSLSLAWSDKSDLMREVASDIAQNLQAQWLRKLSTRVEIAGASPGYFSAPLQLLAVDSDPLNDLAVLEKFASVETSRTSRWKNRAYDLLVSRAELSDEAGAMNAAAVQAQRILLEDEALVWPLFVRGRSSLVAPNLTLSPPEILGNWDFRTSELRPETP